MCLIFTRERHVIGKKESAQIDLANCGKVQRGS